MSNTLKVLGVGEARRYLAQDPATAWVTLAQKYGKTFRYRNLTLTCDPEPVQTLLMRKTHTRRRSRIHRLFRHMPGMAGPLFTEGEMWKRQLHALMPVFHREHIVTCDHVIADATDAFTDAAANVERCPDLFSSVSELGSRIAFEIGYGLTPDQPQAPELRHALESWKSETERSRSRLDDFCIDTRKMLTIPWSCLVMSRRLARVRRIISTIIQDRRARGVHGVNWIDCLHLADFGTNAIACMAAHLFWVYDAVNFIVTCGIYELGRNPIWIDALRVESCAVLGSRSAPALDDLPRLICLSNFMKEVLRRYPGSMGIARQSGSTLSYHGLQIPGGSEILILLHALHHHPDHWDAANAFDPDRWRRHPEPRIPYSFIPFLEGARQCIGRRLAELQFITIISALVRNYTVEIFKDDVRLTPYMVPRFAEAIPFRLRRRSTGGDDGVQE